MSRNDARILAVCFENKADRLSGPVTGIVTAWLP